MRRISRHISAIEIDLSSFRSNQPDNAFQKGRFTSSIRADDRHGLIKFDPEINTVQCLKIAIERGQSAGFQKRAVKFHSPPVSDRSVSESRSERVFGNPESTMAENFVSHNIVSSL